jgi:hypothetical protein
MKGYPTSDFGFTNDPEHIASVREFVAAAVADGWSIEPTYPGHETVEQACRLRRDGYLALCLMREKAVGATWHYETSVHLWGPDGLYIEPPYPYDFAAIEAGRRRCMGCGKANVETRRVGFAGRCCDACLPELRKQHEYPGWTN